MTRFRFTFFAVCLVLLWLGATDILLYLRNQAPAPVPIETVERQEPSRAWLQVTGGYLDLEQAISTSGTLELQALLVPLTVSPETNTFRVLVETRDPELLDFFRSYHFGFDSAAEQQRFRQENREKFHPRRDITGMLISGLVASGNRDKLMKLARTVGMPVPEDVLLLSEGKEPPQWRGFFFAVIGLLGLGRVLTGWRRQRPEPAGQSDLSVPPRE